MTAAILAALLLAALLPACDDDAVSTAPLPPVPACSRLSDFLHNVAVVRPPGSVLDAAAAASHVYTAAGTDGVHVFGLTPGSAPIATIPIADARALGLDGDILCVAAGDGGLVVVDVSNPAAAAPRGTAALPGCTVDVTAAGAFAYVANDDIGVAVVDVSNPEAPRVRGIENTPGKVVAVASRNTLVFAADETNGLRIINASDPDAPFVIKTVAMPGAAKGVAVSGNTALVAAREGGLQLVDVSLPGFASIVGTYPSSRDVVSVAVSGNTAFASVGSAGIRVIDTSQPASPRELQSIGTAAVVRRVAVNDRWLAIADDIAGARSMDIHTPASPAVDTYLAGGDIRSLEKFGNLLVVSDATYGVRVFDPGAKMLVGDVAVSGGVSEFALADSMLYGVNDSAVPVVDLRDPASPAVLTPFPIVGNFDDIAVAGEFLYLLASGGTLVERRRDGTGVARTLNFGGPYLPSLTIEEPYIYLPDRQGSVYIVSRASLRTASIAPAGSSAERVVFRSTDGPFGPVRRGWVIESGLLNGEAGAEVYDYSNIILPPLERVMACAGNAVDAAFTAQYMVMAQGDDGWEVFAFDANGTPSPIGYFPQPARRAVALDDAGRFAVAAGPAGLLLLRADACQQAR